MKSLLNKMDNSITSTFKNQYAQIKAIDEKISELLKTHYSVNCETIGSKIYLLEKDKDFTGTVVEVCVVKINAVNGHVKVEDSNGNFYHLAPVMYNGVFTFDCFDSMLNNSHRVFSSMYFACNWQNAFQLLKEWRTTLELACIKMTNAENAYKSLNAKLKLLGDIEEICDLTKEILDDTVVK
jgi:hypothetical protein